MTLPQPPFVRQAHVNPAYVSCPFCGWHRLPDISKGGTPWNAITAMRELVDHLNAEHGDAWWALLVVAGERPT